MSRCERVLEEVVCKSIHDVRSHQVACLCGLKCDGMLCYVGRAGILAEVIPS
jgi:hypothetical protein